MFIVVIFCVIIFAVTQNLLKKPHNSYFDNTFFLSGMLNILYFFIQKQQNFSNVHKMLKFGTIVS